jgi:hypothetical protein
MTAHRRHLPRYALLSLLILPVTIVGPASRAGQEPARARSGQAAPNAPGADGLFARDNLIAWCIVPFDSKRRSPEERAVMLERLGFRHFAYDWRAEHIPTFDAEIEALRRHGISLDAFWVAPGELNREPPIVLDALKRHGVKAQLWVLLDLGGDRATGPEQERRVAAATAKLRPLAEEAGKIGCSLALYNHGGWFGEPDNQLAILERLREQGITNVGIAYYPRPARGDGAQRGSVRARWWSRSAVRMLIEDEPRPSRTTTAAGRDVAGGQISSRPRFRPPASPFPSSPRGSPDWVRAASPGALLSRSACMRGPLASSLSGSLSTG